MPDERLVHVFSSHTHHGMTNVAVTEVGGVPTVVGSDNGGSVWSWDLLTGQCTRRPLDLDDAAPDDDWYAGWGLRRERVEGRAPDIVDRTAVGQLHGRPVVVTGGKRFDILNYPPGEMGGLVRVWDLETGRRAAKTLVGHHGGIWSLTVTEFKGGPIAVTGSEDCHVMAWDLTSGERIADMGGHVDGMAVAVAEVDGRLMAVSGGHDGSVRVWDVLAGEQVGPLLTEQHPSRAVTITELGGRAVALAGCSDGAVRTWDLRSGEEAGPPMVCHTDDVFAVAATQVAGNTVVVTGGLDGTVRGWDLAGREPTGDPMIGHGEYVESMAIAHVDGTPLAVTASRDATVRVWDLTT